MELCPLGKLAKQPNTQANTISMQNNPLIAKQKRRNDPQPARRIPAHHRNRPCCQLANCQLA